MNQDSRYDVITALDICVDLMMEGDVVPCFGQTEQLVNSYLLEMGGSACIFACQCAKLGLKTVGTGVVGVDLFGGLVLQRLAQAGVDASYVKVDNSIQFIRAFLVSVERIVLAGALTMFVTIITAYPLSKPNREFRGRTVYVWFIALTMLVGGGLIPWYMIIRGLGMLDSIWALVVPGMAPAFSFLLLLNFYRGLPKSLEESAFLDGAGHWRILWQIIVPLSLPAIATLTLFTVVGHWNAWFDGLILMTRPKHYPLQSYMQTLIASTSMQLMTRAKTELLKQISDKTVKSAQIFIGAIPMLALYPFLQRYFMMGIVLGSVKE